MGFSFKGFVGAIVTAIIVVSIPGGAGILASSGFASVGAFSAQFFYTAALGIAMSALAPKPKDLGGFGAGNGKSNRGYQVTASGSALDHQVIYGKMKTGGARIFDGTTGTENVQLHRVLAFAGHEIESFEQIYINDEVATINGSGNVTSPSRYSGLVTIKEHLGTADQAADSSLVSAVSGWTNEHRLRGIAYLYVKLEYDADAFPNGVPEISAVIKGKKVYDPRNTTTAWSDNPALCVRDYLTATGYGLGEATANIKDTAFITAANICDEYVESPVTSIFVGGEYRIKTVGDTDFTALGAADNNVGTVFTATTSATTGTGVVETHRYTANGAFTTGTTPQDLLEGLITSMGATLWYTQGAWNVKAAKWTSTVLDLNEDDLRSGISLATRHSRRDNFNKVNGTFRGLESNWQVTDFPPVTNLTLATALVDGGSYSITEVGTTDFTLVGATSNTVGVVFTADLEDGPATGTGKTNAYVGVDGGLESALDMDLPFTDNSIESRRVARIMLERNRQQLQLQASFGLRAFQVQTGDNVRLTNTRLGWTNKEFEVVSWTFGLQNEYDLQVEMTLKEISESVFDEVDDGIVYERDNTTLLSAFEVPTLAFTTANLSTEVRRVRGKTLGVLYIDVVNTSTIVDKIEVQYKKPSETDFTSLATLGAFVGTERVEVVSVEEGLHDIRVQAINSLGVHGNFTTVSNYDVITLSAPPADVTNFTGNMITGGFELSWTPVPDLDLAHYVIKYSKVLSGASYASATTVRESVPASDSSAVFTEYKPGTYFIKAVDDASSGSNESVNAAKLIENIEAVRNTEVFTLVTESPDFNGVKVNVEKDSTGISLAKLPTFDTAPEATFDARGGVWDDFDSFASTGVYYFENSVDLGSKFQNIVSYAEEKSRFDKTQLFDSEGGLFDAQTTSLFDDAGPSINDVSTEFQTRHTDDDPAGTPTWSDWVVVNAQSGNEIIARAFEFRLKLDSTNTNASPLVSALSATIDMPEYLVSGKDITFTGTTNIVYNVLGVAHPFNAPPAIGLSIANLAETDRYTITNKTRSGFTINTFTGGSASTNSVTIDYVANGYGKEFT